MNRLQSAAKRLKLAADRVISTSRLWPAVIAVGCLTTAGAIVHPALGFAVLGVLALAVDKRLP